MGIIHMTARCGSTIIGQCLEKISNTRVVSEPMPFWGLGALYVKGDISYAEYRNLLESTYRLQCKKESGSNINHIVMKWNPWATAAIPYLKEMHPEINLVLNTRNLNETITSWLKIENLFPISGFVSIAYNLQGERCFDSPVDFDDIKWWKWYRNIDKPSPVHFKAKWVCKWAVIWWGVLEMYLKDKSKYVVHIMYEDIQKDPKQELLKLLNALNIPTHNLASSVEALMFDSQRGVSGKLGLNYREDPTKTYNVINKLFKELKIPFSTHNTVDDLRELLH